MCDHFSGDSGPDRATYLVVLREVLVAQDIAMTISDHDPRANVVIAGTLAEALAALNGVATVARAFVGEAPSRFVDSALAGAIAARGGRVTLMGNEAEDQGAGPQWDVLEMPFDTRAVLALLQMAQSRPDV